MPVTLALWHSLILWRLIYFQSVFVKDKKCRRFILKSGSFAKSFKLLSQQATTSYFELVFIQTNQDVEEVFDWMYKKIDLNIWIMAPWHSLILWRLSYFQSVFVEDKRCGRFILKSGSFANSFKLLSQHAMLQPKT